MTMLDLGIGNLHSLGKALTKVLPAAKLHVETDPRACDPRSTDLLVFPGVGAFTEASLRLRPGRDHLRAVLRDGLPCLGICLGMQLLFDASEEGEGEGLSLIPGKVTRLATTRVPHMGFSPVETTGSAPSWARAWSKSAGASGQATAEDANPTPGTAMYFAHSFACRPVDESVIVAETKLDGDAFPAIVEVHRTVGCQFHPEKSSADGLWLLSGILEHLSGRPETAR